MGWLSPESAGYEYPSYDLFEYEDDYGWSPGDYNFAYTDRGNPWDLNNLVRDWTENLQAYEPASAGMAYPDNIYRALSDPSDPMQPPALSLYGAENPAAYYPDEAGTPSAIPQEVAAPNRLAKIPGQMGEAMVDSASRDPFAALGALGGAGITLAGLLQKTPKMKAPQTQLSPEEKRLLQLTEEKAAASPEDELTQALKARAMGQMGPNREIDPGIQSDYDRRRQEIIESVIRQRGAGAVTTDPSGQVTANDDFARRSLDDLEDWFTQAKFGSGEQILSNSVGQRNQSLGTNISNLGRQSTGLGQLAEAYGAPRTANFQAQYNSEMFNKAKQAEDKQSKIQGGSQLLGYSLGGYRRAR